VIILIAICQSIVPIKTTMKILWKTSLPKLNRYSLNCYNQNNQPVFLRLEKTKKGWQHILKKLAYLVCQSYYKITLGTGIQ
jgi:hypothetical protein